MIMKIDNRPTAEVSVNIFSIENGGRTVHLNNHAYRPHFRVYGSNELLGVEFIHGPDIPLQPGESSLSRVLLLYYPDVSYKELIEGTEFEIVEGPKVIGRGRVIKRI